MRLIYIAGSYRGCSRERVDLHIQAAVHVGVLVAESGDYPIIPHANTALFERLTELGDKFFLDGTLEAMRRCDGVVLCPGWEFSKGALGEIAEAHRLSIPIYACFEDFTNGEQMDRGVMPQE